MSQPIPLDAPDPWRDVALLTPGSRWFAFAAVVLSFVLPANGFGIDLCAVHRTTGLPCPGCGLTRAFISVSDGDLVTAIGLNPFVVVLYPLFFALAVFALLPTGMRGRAEGWLRSYAGAVGRAYKLGLIAFLGFGAVRFGWFLFSGERF